MKITVFIYRNRGSRDVRLYVRAKERQVKLTMGTRRGSPTKSVREKFAAHSHACYVRGENGVFLAEPDSLLLHDGVGTLHSPRVEYINGKYELFVMADGYVPVINLEAAKVAALDHMDAITASASFDAVQRDGGRIARVGVHLACASS